MRILLLIFLLVVGCAVVAVPETKPVRLIMFKDVNDLRDPRWCGKDVLGNFGCWRTIDFNTGGCEIIVVEPRDTDDVAALQTLGKELFKCWKGLKEY